MLFCLASSTAYLINDLFDSKQDREHPIKSLRPLASGKLERGQAIIIALSLGALTCVLSLSLNITLFLILAIYILLNFLYSIWLKHILFIDVLCLAAFFTLRLLAGSYAIHISLSPWIFVLVILQVLFFSFNKRLQELRTLGKRASEHRFVLASYNDHLIDQIMLIITILTLFIYPFYTIDADTIQKIGNAHMLLTIPFFYFGILRYLYLLRKWQKEEDPARIIFSDLFMQVDLFLLILTIMGVIYFAI